MTILESTEGSAATEWFTAAFAEAPVMAVLRGLDPAETVRLADVAWGAGIRHVEVPIESPEAVKSLAAVLRAAKTTGKLVGAGTVVTVEQLETAIELGASYVVSPGFDASLIRDSLTRGIPMLPGVSTASEILAARRLGLNWLKVFPAAVLGSAWVTAMRGPFPEVRFVATGGINGLNAEEFLRAGCSVVGVGGVLGEADHRDILQTIVSEYR